MNDEPQTAQPQTVITRNIALYPEQDATVRELATREFDGNYSAALRKIIRLHRASIAVTEHYVAGAAY